MKKIFLIILFCGYIVNLGAQEIVTKIKFEDKLHWEEVKKKAELENKYIFVNFYTTWCVPCKRMDKFVFTQDSVVNFLNDNFICVKYQCDTSKNDSLNIKQKYRDSHLAQRELKPVGYPTYAVLKPNGELLNRISGYRTAQYFLEEIKTSLNPETNYLTLVKEFDNGKRDEGFLLKLVNLSLRFGDYANSPRYKNAYLLTQKDLLTVQNIKFVGEATEHSTDIGFKILCNFANKIDSVLGKNTSKDKISTIIFNEIAIPFLRKNGKTEYRPASMMIVYHGDVNTKVNWGGLRKEVDKRCPKFSLGIMNYAKINYYSWTKNWAKLTQFIDEKINRGVLTNRFIETAMLSLYEECQDKKMVAKALNWYNNSNYIRNEYSFWIKSDLLFKLGRKSEAVNEVLNNLTKDDLIKNESIRNAVKKMEKGKSRFDN